MASRGRSTNNRGRLGEELYMQPERFAFVRGRIDPRNPRSPLLVYRSRCWIWYQLPLRFGLFCVSTSGSGMHVRLLYVCPLRFVPVWNGSFLRSMST